MTITTDSVQESITTSVKSQEITLDWDPLAIDDGRASLKFGEYTATFASRDGEVFTTGIEGIRFSPEVNSAPPATVDIPPDSRLDGTDFLAGELVITVNNENIFAGSIVRIDTTQNELGSYTVKAESPGKEIEDQTIDQTVSSISHADYAAKIIDNFNSTDQEFDDLAGTSDETLTNITIGSDGERTADDNNAKAEYAAVGSSGLDIEVVYAKVFTSGDIDFKVDTSSSEYTETLNGLTGGENGEWVRIDPFGLEDEQYDLIFDMDGNSILYDWRVLTERTVLRTVDPISDEEIIDSKSFTGNRLAVLSNITDESDIVYRWDGNNCQIFQKGSRTTTVDVHEEDIKSTRDISDTYASAEVVGSGGVSSGTITSADAPSYVTKHKEIRDPDVTTTEDAKRKARLFLEDHGDIIFEGDIKTLPTRAPVGETMSGSNFDHGQDMDIESVRYGKRRSSISLGRDKQISDKFIGLDRDTDSANVRDTS